VAFFFLMMLEERKEACKSCSSKINKTVTLSGAQHLGEGNESR
jgi:hypothetical protein